MSTPRRIRKKNLTPLEASINAAIDAVKGGGSALQRHHAMGRLEVLWRVKELADSYREEMKQLWHGRGNDALASCYYNNRDTFTSLHCLTESEVAK